MTMMSTERVVVTGGVDTHKDTHTAAALDERGRVLGTRVFPATPHGYRDLAGWLAGFGAVAAVGVEGTGAYGAGLTRHLLGLGLRVVEVNRPDRSTRRRVGKSDPIDALSAARAVQSGQATVDPKTSTGVVESLRMLRVDKNDLVSARVRLANRIQSLLVTAPEPMRTQLRGLAFPTLVQTLAGWPSPITGPEDRVRAADPQVAAILVLGGMARRYQQLQVEIKELEAILAVLCAQIAPDLLAVPGVGPDTASQLLVSAGANPQRLHSEAAFAALTATNPIPASSGRTDRHRHNRGGDRQANAAIHRIVLSRLRWPTPETTAYIQRRTKQGKTKPEIMRCLKRYIARELYPYLLKATTT